MFSNDRSRDTTNSVFNKELGLVVEEAMQHIPLDYRMVFTLREVNGLSVDETAEVLQISHSNVKVRLNRAKAMLRKEIETSYTPEDIFEFNLIYCDALVENVMSKLRDISSG